jgi:predicted RNase H-like nuclease (RuvC/YqgF family)
MKKQGSLKRTEIKNGVAGSGYPYFFGWGCSVQMFKEQKFKQDYEREQREYLKRIKELEDEVERLKSENYALIYQYRPVKLGRKLKLTRQVIKQIKQLHDEGMPQRKIAEQLSISVGLVNKGVHQ